MADDREPPRYRIRGYGDQTPPPPPPPSPPAPPPFGGGLLGFILQWVSEIHTWQRALIAITLGAAVFLGYLIWENQARVLDALDDAFQTTPVGTLPRMLFRYELNNLAVKLFGTLQPDCVAVSIWSIAALQNKMVLESVVVIDELRPLANKYESTRWSNPVPLFTDNPRVNLLVAAVLRDRFACDDSRMLWPIIQKIPSMQEVCVAGIPPDALPVAGFLAVGFHEWLGSGDQDRVRVAMQAAAVAALRH